MKTEMNSKTVNELVEAFENKLTAIKIELDLRSLPSYEAEKCDETMNNVSKDLMLLKNTFVALREEIKKGWDSVRRANEMEKRILQQKNRIAFILSNLPTNLPDMEPTNDISDFQYSKAPRAFSESTAIHQQPERDISVPTRAKSARIEKKPISSIESLTKKEFDAIPKYMKGRLTLVGLNDAVNDFNRAIERKYTLLNKSQSKVGQFEITLYKLYKQQETNDTKGVFFCSRDDLRKFNSYKFDNATKSILTCLCHCKKIRYLYNAGSTFYAIV